VTDSIAYDQPAYARHVGDRRELVDDPCARRRALGCQRRAADRADAARVGPPLPESALPESALSELALPEPTPPESTLLASTLLELLRALEGARVCEGQPLERLVPGR